MLNNNKKNCSIIFLANSLYESIYRTICLIYDDTDVVSIKNIRKELNPDMSELV